MPIAKHTSRNPLQRNKYSKVGVGSYTSSCKWAKSKSGKYKVIVMVSYVPWVWLVSIGAKHMHVIHYHNCEITHRFCFAPADLTWNFFRCMSKHFVSKIIWHNSTINEQLVLVGQYHLWEYLLTIYGTYIVQIFKTVINVTIKENKNKTKTKSKM